MAIDTVSPFGRYASRKFAKLVWTICNLTVFSATTRLVLRKNVAHRFEGPFDVKVSGIKWRLYPQDNYCDRVILSRNHLPEQAEHRAINNIIKPGMCFVDIGSNIGSYTLHVAIRSSNKARIIALEPQPETFRKLCFNLSINQISNITTLQLACGPEKKTMRLWSGGSNVGITSLLKEATSTSSKQAFDVSVIPLKDILSEQNIQHIDLLKIDIEGFEDQALVPFFETAPKTLWPHHVLIETSHQTLWRQNITVLMELNGYQAVLKTEDNVLFSLSETD